MRKLKKINGYLVVRFNDREKREYEGTGLGNFGVIDAELYTGILDVDRSVMEYDDAATLEIALEPAPPRPRRRRCGAFLTICWTWRSRR